MKRSYVMILLALFYSVCLMAEPKTPIVLEYGKSGREVIASVYNARDKKGHKEYAKIEKESDHVKVRADFTNAQSLNSYLSIQDKELLNVDLKIMPVMEITLKSSTARRPLTLVWKKHFGKRKVWNCQTLYFNQANIWQTFQIRLDGKHKNNVSMTKIDSFAVQKNYEGNEPGSSTVTELLLGKVVFRAPSDGDVYVDGNRPLVRLPATFKALPAEESLFTQFKFGLWGTTLGGMSMGVNDPFYCDDDDAIAGRFRANYLNSIMYPTTVWRIKDKKKAIWKARIEPRFRSRREVLLQQVSSCRKYHMTMAPLTQFVPRIGKFDVDMFKKKFLPLIDEFSDAPEIFGWYLTDEPYLDFMSTYNQVYPLIQKVAPKQVPFVNLCNRYTAYRFSGEDAGMLVTDFYPLKSNSRFLPKDRRGKRNPWAVIDWVSEMEEFASGKPHYLILSTHTFFGTEFPTDAELRLQVYLSLAHGADSLFFFIPDYGPFWLSKYIDRTLQDPYGNPSEVWATLGELGKRLIPVGGFVAGATLDRSLKVTFGKENPRVKVFGGERPGVEAVVRRRGNRYVILVWNNDLKRKAGNAVSFSPMPHGSRLFDLEDLCPSDGRFQLKPGDGKIFMVTADQDFQRIRQEAQAIRLINERMRLLYEMEKVAGTYPEARNYLTLLDRAATEADIMGLEKDFRKLVAGDDGAVSLTSSWEDVRRNMGRLHRLMSDNIEAPKVIMYQYGTYPISALREPGRGYVRQMFQMSLAFREIERNIHRQGVRKHQAEIQLMAQVSREFLALVQREFKGGKPKSCGGIREAELLGIIGQKKWDYYKKFLRKW